jgi:hypothetical protein
MTASAATLMARIARILAAYVCSSLFTGYVVYGFLLFSEAGAGEDARAGGPPFGLLISFFVAWFASFPAALTVCVGEWFFWRRPWPYGVAGSLIGLALGAAFQPPSFFPQLGLGLGIFSGLVFWALAGRQAGSRDPQQRLWTVLVMGLLCGAGLFLSGQVYFGLLRWFGQ